MSKHTIKLFALLVVVFIHGCISGYIFAPKELAQTQTTNVSFVQADIRFNSVTTAPHASVSLKQPVDILAKGTLADAQDIGGRLRGRFVVERILSIGDKGAGEQERAVAALHQFLKPGAKLNLMISDNTAKEVKIGESYVVILRLMSMADLSSGALVIDMRAARKSND